MLQSYGFSTVQDLPFTNFSVMKGTDKPQTKIIISGKQKLYQPFVLLSKMGCPSYEALAEQLLNDFSTNPLVSAGTIQQFVSFVNSLKQSC